MGFGTDYKTLLDKALRSMGGSAIPLGCPMLTRCCCAFWMVVICCATTDNTSMSIRLNSSKQAQAPALSQRRHLGRAHTQCTLGTSFQQPSDLTGEEAAPTLAR